MKKALKFSGIFIFVYVVIAGLNAQATGASPQGTELRTLRAENAMLKAQVATLKKKVGELSAVLSAVRGENAVLQKQVAELAESAKAAGVQVQGLLKELAAAAGEKAVLRKQVGGLNLAAKAATEKMQSLSKELAAARAAAPTSRPAKRPAYVITDWEFEWTLAKSGKVLFVIEKTAEFTRCWFRANYDSLLLTPADAQALSPVLAKAGEYQKKLKPTGKESLTESVTVGDFTVTFRYNPKFGFDVSVRRDRSFGDSISMSRAEAEAMATVMADVKAKAAFVDERIKP